MWLHTIYEDINECRSLIYNNCSVLCHNTPGGYTCSCPNNKTGDGYRTGTGCIDSHRPPGKYMPYIFSDCFCLR